MKRHAATAALCLVLAACSTDDTSTPTPDPAPKADANGCIPVPRTGLDYLAQNTDPEHDVQLLDGAAREIPAAATRHGLRYFVAVRLDGDHRVALFATSDLDGGPVIPADAYAREYFTWGADVTEESDLGRWIQGDRTDPDLTILKTRLEAERCMD